MAVNVCVVGDEHFGLGDHVSVRTSTAEEKHAAIGEHGSPTMPRAGRGEGRARPASRVAVGSHTIAVARGPGCVFAADEQPAPIGEQGRRLP